MNKPIVVVKENKRFVAQFSLILTLNSGPLIYLGLTDKLDSTVHKSSDAETLRQEFLPHIYREQEGSFQWQGTTFKFLCVGYNSFKATTFELVGLVVGKDLIEWFKTNHFKNKKQDYLIYQKPETKNVWPFYNQVFGEKFSKPNEDLVQKINFLFPKHGCIWRDKNSDNFNFLNKATTFANRYLPEIQGWCAFDNKEPLRLILFEKEKRDLTIPKLDETWTPISYPFLPNRYSWNRLSDRSCTLSRELSITTDREIALIEQLVSDGSNGENEKKGQNFQDRNPTRLLFAPGTVAIGNKNIFCHTITYEFKLPTTNKELPSIKMKVELDYPNRAKDNDISSLRLFGSFQKWCTKTDGETVVKIAPPDTNNWGVLDEKTQKLKTGDEAVLHTKILSPTYSNEEYSGIYIKHQEKDEMIFDIQPCSIPLALGSIQKYRQQLEEADVTLCGQKLAFSVSPHNQKLANAEAIIIDNVKIKLNHRKAIFGQAQKNVNFRSKSIDLGSSKIKIKSARTKINSRVNISRPIPRLPKPNPPAPRQVFAKVNGRTKTLQITPDTKIGDLKKQLSLESNNRLTYGGRFLQDELTVADYNIQKDSTLEVLPRIPGGGNGVSTAKQKIEEGINKRLFGKNSERLNSLIKNNDIGNYVRDEVRDRYNERINELPRLIDSLETLKNFADTANNIYNTLNHSNEPNSESRSRNTTIMNWRTDVQKSLYDLRDKIFKTKRLNPEEAFGLTSQFKQKFPEERIPPDLEQIKLDPKLLTFTDPSKTRDSNSNYNDCGEFAEKLLEARQEAIKEKAESDREEARRIAENTRKVVLNYPRNSSVLFNYHARTSLARNNNDIYTLEANTAKPFQLSPELFKYTSQGDFEAQNSQNVTRVDTSTLNPNDNFKIEFNRGVEQ